MQFTSVQDINAPLDFVFSQLSDFENYESYATRIGAQVERRDELTEIGAGMMWNFVGELRGKTRDVDIELITFARPNDLGFRCRSSEVKAEIKLRATALTRKQTRIKIATDFRPVSIAARLVIQSARLAKNSLNRKYNRRIWEYTNHIESAYHKHIASG